MGPFANDQVRALGTRLKELFGERERLGRVMRRTRYETRYGKPGAYHRAAKAEQAWDRCDARLDEVLRERTDTVLELCGVST